MDLIFRVKQQLKLKLKGSRGPRTITLFSVHLLFRKNIIKM